MSGTTRTSRRSMPMLVRYSAIWPMFLSLVRPDRISSPITSRAAVMISAGWDAVVVMRCFLFGDFSPRPANSRWTGGFKCKIMPIRRCRDRLKTARDREVSMRAFGIALAALCALAGGSAMAQGVVRIGVMNDMSGVYSDDQGPGSLLAAQMAVEDYG